MSKGPISHVITINGPVFPREETERAIFAAIDEAAARGILPGRLRPNLAHLDNVTGVTFDGVEQPAAEARASEAECGARCDEPARRLTLGERLHTRRLAMGYPRVRDLAGAVVASIAYQHELRDPADHDALLLHWCRVIDRAESADECARYDLRPILDALSLSDLERSEWHAEAGYLPIEMEMLLLAHPDRWTEVERLLSTPRRSR
jgi:hypothetical protein